MKILIIGTGNIGTTMSADLTMKGHTVTLLKTTAKINGTHYDKIKENNMISYKDLGKEEISVKISKITNDFDDAFKNSPELIIVCLQTNCHEALIKKIVKYLDKTQMLLLEPGYLSTAFVLKYCPSDKLPIIIEAESSPIDCRIIEDGRVSVLFKNVRNPIGVYPNKLANETLDKLDVLGYNFVLVESVLAAALHNPNLIVHTIGAIMSIPRIEYSKGEYWMYKEVFTESVWSLVEKLDDEKLQVLEKLGLKRIPYVEACRFRNSKDLTIDAKKIFFEYAYNSSPKGPNVSNSRYITEDVPQGLVLLESLGKILNVKTPICTSLIELAGACLKSDFRKDGRTIEILGKENLERIINDRK